MSFEDGLVDIELFEGESTCLMKMNCCHGSTMEGKEAWEPQYESKECTMSARGGRGSVQLCSSSAALCACDAHPSECNVLHAVSSHSRIHLLQCSKVTSSCPAE